MPLVGAWRSLSEGVWFTQREPETVNIGLIAGTQGAMLIDAGASAECGARLAAEAVEVAGVPLTHVLITHPHYDHWLGLAGISGVTSLGHENTQTPEAIAESGSEEPPRITETFSLVKAVDLGGRRVEMLHLGEAHTNADCFAVSGDVVFAGDLLESAGDPQFGPTSSARTWPSALDGLIAACTDDTLIVPGHGEPMDRYQAIRQQGELAMLYSQAENLLQRGVRVEDAYEATEWPFSEATVRSALPRIYDDLQARGVRRQLPISAL